jgi:hypothetical protein
MSGSNGGSGGQGGHYAGSTLGTPKDVSGLIYFPAIGVGGVSRDKDRTLQPIGYDARGPVWQCPRCRTHLRPSQIHTCGRYRVSLVCFVGGKAEYHAN